MGSFSMAHWLVVAVVVLVLFGRGKISETMADFGKGIRSFRKGISEDDPPRSQLPAAEAETIQRARTQTWCRRSESKASK